MRSPAGRYIRHHGERWDLTAIVAIVEPLDLLGQQVGRVDVGWIASRAARR
jgi:hypothetical protein